MISGPKVIAHAESMQNQERWRKSVRAIITVNSMRPSNRKAPSVVAADEDHDVPHESPPGELCQNPYPTQSHPD